MKSLKRVLSDIVSWGMRSNGPCERKADHWAKRRLLIEQLEDRQMLTTTLYWIGAVSSNWNISGADANWSLNGGGGSNRVWDNDPADHVQAVFAGSGGTINIAPGIVADSIQINSGTDTFSDNSVAVAGGVQVAAGSNLTANQIVAGSLLIGGTETSPATVTIAASQNGVAPALLSWDPKASGGTALGGNGNWNATVPQWWNGSTDVVWDSAAVADFSGVVGSVTVANGISARGLDFTISGYTISGGSLATQGVSVNPGIQATIGSPLNGSNGFDLTGGGTLLISGPNTYAGPTILTASTLMLGSSSALGQSSYITASPTRPGILDLNGQSIGSDTPLDLFPGTVINSSSTPASCGAAVNDQQNGSNIIASTLNIAGTGTITMSGVVDGTSSFIHAPFSIVKSDSSTLILTAQETYSGATSINGGTLQLASGSGFYNTAINVSDGATFALQPGPSSISAGDTGTGTNGATLSLDPGSTLDMTDGSTGTFQIHQQSGFSGASLSISDATLDFELSGSQADELVTDGAASVSGVNTINVAGLGSSLSPGTYTLISAASGLSGDFEFSNLAPFEAVTVGGQTYTLVLSSTANALSINVAILDPATLSAQSFSISPDQAYLFGDNLLEHVIDASGKIDAMAAIAQIGGQSYTQDGQTFTTAHGSVMAFDNGDFQYFPTDSFVGSDSFSYTVTTGSGATMSATVTLNVPAGQLTVGQIPDQQWLIDGYDNLDLNSYFQDTRYGVDQLTFNFQTSNSMLRVYSNTPDGELTLVADDIGMSDVTVTATDPDGASVSATFQCNIWPASAPVPVGVDYTLEDGIFAGALNSLWATDSTENTPTADFVVSVRSPSNNAPAHWQASGYRVDYSIVDGDASIGTDPSDPSLEDVHWQGSKGMGPAVVKLTVRATLVGLRGQPLLPVPYADANFYISVGSGPTDANAYQFDDQLWAPVAGDSDTITSSLSSAGIFANYVTDAGTPLTANVYNATLPLVPYGPPFPVSDVLDSAPTHGTLELSADTAETLIDLFSGTFTYTPDPGFSGDDSFTYHAVENGVSSNVATITIHVAGQLNLVPDIADLSDVEAHGLGTPPSVFSEVPPSGATPTGQSAGPSDQSSDPTTLTDSKDVEIWYRDNKIAIKDDVINASRALFDAYRRYLKSDSTFGERTAGYLARYAIAKLNLGPYGTEIKTAVMITENEAKVVVSGIASGKKEEFADAEEHLIDRAQADAIKQLDQARKDLLAALAANPNGIAAPPIYQAQSKAQHLSNILTQWWGGNIPRIEIVHSIVGQPQNVNIPAPIGGYDLDKIFKGINTPSFRYHLKDLSVIVDSQQPGVVLNPDLYKQFLTDAEAAMVK